MKYLFFDLDGTLCESKQLIEPRMLRELERLNDKFKVVIVSGAELSRIHTQCPLKYIAFMAQNGNQVLDNDEVLWNNEMTNKEEVREHISKIANEQGITIGEDMIDDRGAQISFSFIGHHAPHDIKKAFDPDRRIRSRSLELFPFKGALIGGTTCIDYIPHTKGENIKRYIELKKIKPHDCLYIGDAFMKYGNDETVLGVIPVHKITSPLETFNFVRQITW